LVVLGLNSEVIPGLRDMGHNGTTSAVESVEARIAALEWAGTPAGPAGHWSASLRTVLRLMLSSRYAMWMGWGAELTFFCNDTYRDQTLGVKYPWALGRPAREVWAEIWDIIGPRIEHVLTTGQATYDEGLLLFLERSGYPEETYHSFSYSAAPADAEGQIGGLFCVVVEETERVIGERRIAFLGHFAARLSHAKTAEDVFAALRECLTNEARDIPFSLTYLLDEDGRFQRILRTGFEGPHEAAPDTLDATDGTSWPLESVLSAGPSVVDLDRGKKWPMGPWKLAPSRALLVPIPGQGDSRPVGVFIAGLNAHRPADDGARRFVGLLVGQLAAGLSSAGAYEAERRRAEALTAIDRAKTTFFSNISHEFRTPLTLMLGPLEDALAAPERVLGGADLEAAHRNAVRLQKLVNALLDFSRIEAGRVRAAYEPTDLAAFTGELASVFRSAIERAGLRLVVESTPIDAPVYVDHDMWEKIVLNLLSNALKFTFEGEIAVSLRRAHDQVVLSVSDTGVGIPVAELPHLFERFHRVHGAKARTQEGSGIGLALVNELVKLHGGEIHAESIEGKGTTFTVRIPVGSMHLDRARIVEPSPANVVGAAPYVEEALRWLPPAPDRVASLPAPAAPGGGLGEVPDARVPDRIVLADDNADMREYVARLLGGRWRIESVPDGVAALDAVRRERPALVLSDVMMPRLDGFGLLRALRQDAELRTVPVILLSARAGEEATAEGLHAGANDYLIKPFSARELVARVSAQIAIAKVRDAERGRLLKLLEQVPATVNFLRGPDLVLDFVHPMAARALGNRELLGRPLLEAVPEWRDQPYPERLRRVYETGESFTQHEAMVPIVIDGRQTVGFWDSVNLPVRDEHGRIEGVMTFDLDVTANVVARRRLESMTLELQRSRAMLAELAERERVARLDAEGASHAKDEFLAMLGHELRNPLAPIATAVHLLKLRSGQEVSREVHVIDRQAQHIARLVDDLLDIARITRGKVILAKKTVEMAVLVAAAIETASPAIEVGHHALLVRVPKQGLAVDADPGRMTQVLANLLANAAKYTTAGGRITITAARERAEVIVTVEDTGIGIAPDLLPHVFDLFIQARQTLDRAQGGLGLGLAIVKSLVLLHGGSVTARSDGEGRGSAFTLRLPAVDAMALPREPVVSALEGRAVAQGAKRVLVVDDNVDGADMLAEALEALGYLTAIAYDGPQALRVAADFAPHVALLDLGLPVMDGYELAQRLCAQVRGVRLVAITGYGQREDRRRSSRAGFQAHVTKPVDIDKLQRLLAQILDANVAAPPVEPE